MVKSWGVLVLDPQDRRLCRGGETSGGRNVEGAKRVGMHAVQFHSPEQCAADLARLGVVIP